MPLGRCKPERPGGGYSSSSFRYRALGRSVNPSASVALQSGWTVAERDAGAAQIYKTCASCEHGGEERGELTLGHGAFRLAAEVRHQTPTAHDRNRAEQSPHVFDRRSAWVGVHGAAKEPPDRVRPQRLQDRSFRVAPRSDGRPRTAKTVTIFIDPHEATKARTPGFMKNARVLLRTLGAALARACDRGAYQGRAENFAGLWSPSPCQSISNEPARARRPAESDRVSRGAPRARGSPSRSYGVMRIATSYFDTDVRCPGVSSLGIAFRISSPRA